MKLVVKKFGGTSVGSVTRIRSVATLIVNFIKEHPDTRVVVVSSAMSGETDKLLALAKSCVNTPELRELDQLVATGEQVSTSLLAMALSELGYPAQSMLGIQAGILTSDVYSSADILQIKPDNILRVVSKGIIPVICGFQGATAEGDVTTLGRGGSDISAVAVAAALGSCDCYIYTDVEGVYSADPRYCKNVKLLKDISHEEMLELASQGAKVLHPRAVEFAYRYNVPLVTLSTFKPGRGTRVVREDKLMEKPIVSGITYKFDEARLTLRKFKGGTKSLSEMFNELARNAIIVDMIAYTPEDNDLTTVNFTVPDDLSDKALEIVRNIVPKIGAEGVALDRDIAKVTVVGTGMRTHSGVAAQMFTVLADEGIDIGMISTSEIKISALIPRKYGEVAVRALHQSFIEDNPEIEHLQQ